MSFRKTRLPDDCSPKEFLQKIETNRGVWVSEEESVAWRTWFLNTLAKPPKLELAVAIPWLIVAIAGCVFCILGVVKWHVGDVESSTDSVGLGFLFLFVGLYFVFANFRACRFQRHKPLEKRLAEISELYRAGLIDEQEQKRIRDLIIRGADDS